MDIELEITFKFSTKEYKTTLEIDQETILEEVIEFLKTNYFEFSIKDCICYSEQKQQNLKLDDNFKYVEKMDKLIISAEKEFIIQLDFGDVIENKIVSLSQFDTIKDLKEHLQKYLNKGSKLEQINIEIYKDGILQTDETITLYKLLDLDEKSIQPKIKAKSISQNQQNQQQNNKENLNKQYVGQLQTDSQILFEVYLLKELINSKFKNLETQLMKILEDQKKNILKELEFFERDINQNQQLFDVPFIWIKNLDWFQQKQISFRNYQMIALEHVQQIFTELKKFEFNVLKEQEEINKKQQYSSRQQKAVRKNQNKVDEKNLLQSFTVQLQSSVTFEELIEYTQILNPSIFWQYIQAFGPINQWTGFSTVKSIFVSHKEKISNYLHDKILFGPFHINIQKIIQEECVATIKLYGLNNQHQV